MRQYFEVNGNLFNVDVITFERQFENLLTENAGTTQDGLFHWDAKGQETYLACFRARPGQEQQLDELWRELLRNQVHSCAFPEGSRDAYVQSCRQVLDSTRGGYHWGDLEVRFRTVTVGEDSYVSAP